MSTLPPSGPQRPDGLAALREAFRLGKSALLQSFAEARASAPAATRLVRALARHVDHTLATLWRHCAVPETATLVAVGGYGRGELFPHSDVDVLVLLPDAVEAADAAGPAVERFVTACWDVGLEIGSSVRSVAGCLAEAGRDVTVQTALLEARAVCGRRALFEQLRGACVQAMDARAFLRAKTARDAPAPRQVRRTRPTALEPNTKESPGGLRDLHVVLWTARAAGFGHTLARPGALAAWLTRGSRRARCVRNERTLQADPRNPAHRGRTPRRPAGVRSAGRRWPARFGLQLDDPRRASEEC
jgi:[protein-PII] uridylyltransferase